MFRTRRLLTAAIGISLAVLLSACEPASPEATVAAQFAGEKPAPQLSVEQVIEKYFGGATSQANKIVRCESGFNPDAVSRTNDHGLFQINQVHRANWPAVTGAPWADRYDAELNTVYAKYLYDREGWRPWSCRRVL
jgi:hypothetical protein